MSIGEFSLIERYFCGVGAARSDVILGVGDDGAVLRPPIGCDLVAVSDTLVEGVHFPTDSLPESIGHRALAVNLSDIAAMGAIPAWAFLSLSLPIANESWVSAFMQGFQKLSIAHAVALVGGDTTRGPLNIGVQVMGFVPQGQGLRRSGAQPGDYLCVSGTPGDAAAGLALLQVQNSTSEHSSFPYYNAPENSLLNRFLFPTPRLALGLHLREFASACIDISDGLLGDATKLMDASNCAAEIDLDLLPYSPALKNLFSAEQALDYMLTGGDDYELVFSISPARFDSLRALEEDVPLRKIGMLQVGSGVTLKKGGLPFIFKHIGFDHFKKN